MDRKAQSSLVREIKSAQSIMTIVAIAVALFVQPMPEAVLSASPQPAKGEISGRIENPTGSPASNLDVAILPAKTRLLANKVLGVGPNVVVIRTDKSGGYQASNIASGQYLVAAGTLYQCPASASCLTAATLANPTFFPGVSELDKAQVVTVDSRTVTADFKLADAQGRLRIN